MNAVREDAPPNYEILLHDASSGVPNMNAPLMTSVQNVIQPPPAYSISPETKASNVLSVTPQWVLATAPPQNVDSSSPFYTTFLKAKPKALGIVLIVAAVLQICLAIGLIFTLFTVSISSGIPFWGSVFYIIAGGLTIGAQCKPNICLVKGSLSLNIISSIFSFIALILNCADLATMKYYGYNYYNYNDYNSSNSYYYYYRKIYQEKLAGAYAIQSFLLLINLLLFCVSLSVSIFGCRSLSRVQPNAPQVFMIQNDVVVSMVHSTIPTTFSATFPPIAQPAPPPLYTVQAVQAKPVE
ncbi:uncharacterized protein LOC142095262 [Mixophyes fleayi]|uniref:uncharacterized protein LOC142095262 n=1 Tax=Mixophyes fleayi TaxID=3061075 RepID=UPI003F4D9881